MQAQMLNISVGQLLEIEPMSLLKESEIKWKYAWGQPLVHPDKVKDLPTRMYELRQWYMNVGVKTGGSRVGGPELCV